MQTTRTHLLAKLVMFFSCLTLACGYGIISAHFQIFPYPLVHDALLAVKALRKLRKENPKLSSVEFWDETGTKGPVYSTVSPGSGTEPVLILGNQSAYRDAQPGNSYLAWIATRQGDVLHAWRDPGEIWAPLQGRKAVGDKWRSYPVGAHLYPNGDLLVSFQGVGVFPYAMGLAKFDKDSRLIWKNPDLLHHWFSVGAGGEIYIPRRKAATSPLQLGDYEKKIVCDEGTFGYDVIEVLDPSGKRIKQIDMVDSLVRSDLVGLFSVFTEGADDVVETCDPTHLNDAQILSEEMAAEYPLFQAGDILVSFRTLNTIGVIDPRTGLFKWHYQGSAHQQHSPRFIGDNVIVYVDNLGGLKSRGTSRIMAVNVGTSKTETVFPRSGNALPQRTFRTKTAGHIDISRMGDRILASWTRQGLVWEVDVKTGEVLWEFINTHEVDGRPARISVHTAKYVPTIDFEMNRGRLN